MWGAIIAVGIQLLGWFLDRAKVSKEAKERYLEFIKAAANDLKSVKLKEYGRKQMAQLKELPWKETP